jgi:saccharopine dehydrogenase-like NADP-dependent oxidoreductase
MRVLVLGGSGNFGARIVRALKDDEGIELLAASRRARPVPGAEMIPVAPLNLDAPDLEAQLRALSPEVVVHTVGPFQGQDYRVARAALACNAHYLDLADGRSFVSEFGAALDTEARRIGRVAISGASTLPALSSAVVDTLTEGLTPETIEIAIAPGQCAPRGKATLQAVFSYLGEPVRLMEHGRWRTRTGWMDLRRVRLPFGSRWSALCDVPDLALFPERYPAVRTVRFHAALEIGVQHFALWLLAALVRLRVPVPVARWCADLERVVHWFDHMEPGAESSERSGNTH